MSNSWWESFKNADPAPSSKPDETAKPKAVEPPAIPRGSLPDTYLAAAAEDGASRPRLFDPALLHLRAAFRPGDPRFPDEETGRRWTNLRRKATDHVLRRIAESKFAEVLILRGSRLMKVWFGDLAREPGDLDWVADLPMVDRPMKGEGWLFDALIAAVVAGPHPEGIEFVENKVASDDIWTYERAPGRRFVFPWRAEGLPGGSVQVDVVFGETLADPDILVEIPLTGGGSVAVRAASPAQSLAWKLVWLASDIHAQGKDLFDAVLLAERFPLSREVLEISFKKGCFETLAETAAGFMKGLSVDWDNFQAEYPWIGGDEESWLNRLEIAIGPSFGEQVRLK